MRYNRHFPMQRPSWWPENVPWPPRREGFRHNQFFRRLGCFFGVFNLLGLAFFVLLVALIVKAFGLANLTSTLQLALPLGLAVLGLIIVIILLAIRGLRRISIPFDDLLEAAGRVAEGDYSTHVQEKGPPEVRSLVRAFNNMASRLHQVDEQRRNLLADATHELRTPLTIIQGNLEGIIDGVYQPTPEHINTTLEETRLLARLVNDLQTLSLAETGQLPLHPTRFLLADLIDDLTSSFSSQAASLGIDLKTSMADKNQELTADYDRLNQVLSNLVSNALRYTPRGGTITINTEAIQNGTRITLHDTGSGIPAEDLPFVFDRFWRGDRSRSERTHSGLGLAIAKQLIRAHGGTIAAQSAVGSGSSFVIELPET